MRKEWIAHLMVNPPLYLSLGLDIDADHNAEAIPERVPSAEDGAKLGVTIPDAYLKWDYYLAHTPSELTTGGFYRPWEDALRQPGSLTGQNPARQYAHWHALLGSDFQGRAYLGSRCLSVLIPI